MKNWANMNAGDWNQTGKQLDMLALDRGDGYGTGDLLALADELATAATPLPVRLPWTAGTTPLWGAEQLVIGAA